MFSTIAALCVRGFLGRFAALFGMMALLGLFAHTPSAMAQIAQEDGRNDVQPAEIEIEVLGLMDIDWSPPPVVSGDPLPPTENEGETERSLDLMDIDWSPPPR